MTRTAAFLAALALAAPVLLAQGEPPRMSDVMSPAEMKETGINMLSKAQRAALDDWLARYTALIERAASHGAANAGGGAAAAAPAPQPDESIAGPTAVPYGSRIAEVLDGGTRILLNDGTVWEVNLPDRPATSTWQKGDYVIVVARSIEINNTYFFELINGRAESQAAVAWRGKK